MEKIINEMKEVLATDKYSEEQKKTFKRIYRKLGEQY